MSVRPALRDRLSAWLAATTPVAVATQNLAVGLAYVALGELVLVPRFVGGDRATPVWPADGLAVAAVWFLGPRVLPGIAAAAALVIGVRAPLGMALIGAAGPVLQALIVVRLLKALQFNDRLERLRDPLLLGLVAPPAGAAVAATIGTASAWLFGAVPSAGLPFGWLLWFMRDWLGIAMFAPLVLAWVRARPFPSTTRRLAEASALVVGLLAVAALLAVLWTTPPTTTIPVAFLALPFVMWSGIRFGARGASAVVAILALLTVMASVFGIGPAFGQPAQRTQVIAFAYLMLASLLGQLLAAMKAERDDALARRVQLEEQLRHSQKMEAIGRLTGGVAHDFNNLLTAIIGYTEILLDELTPDDPRHADAEQIGRAAMRATELTRHMLSFSRRQRHQPTVVDVNRILTKMAPMLRRVLGEDITLTITPQAGRALARVDAGQLEQVVMNLAVNARDAMPKGGRLTIETRELVLDEATAAESPDAHPGSFVAISVTDTGTGMPPAVRDRLFEPYFTTKEAGKGTGLGLSTAYGIIRQADGHVTVTSEVGMGTTFRVMLPLAEEEGIADGDATVQALPAGTEYVLLVEDDGSVRHLGRDLLTRLGYTVTEAASGRSALAIGSDDTRHFDLVLCDVMLGDMSGTAVAEALRALRPSVRVLYMSGHTDEALVRTGVLNEGRPFLEKPFTPLQLARKIREVLEDREAGAA